MTTCHLRRLRQCCLDRKCGRRDHMAGFARRRPHRGRTAARLRSACSSLFGFSGGSGAPASMGRCRRPYPSASGEAHGVDPAGQWWVGAARRTAVGRDRTGAGGDVLASQDSVRRGVRRLFLRLRGARIRQDHLLALGEAHRRVAYADQGSNADGNDRRTRQALVPAVLDVWRRLGGARPRQRTAGRYPRTG